eukprot:35980_1
MVILPLVNNKTSLFLPFMGAIAYVRNPLSTTTRCTSFLLKITPFSLLISLLIHLDHTQIPLVPFLYSYNTMHHHAFVVSLSILFAIQTFPFKSKLFSFKSSSFFIQKFFFFNSNPLVSSNNPPLVVPLLRWVVPLLVFTFGGAFVGAIAHECIMHKVLQHTWIGWIIRDRHFNVFDQFVAVQSLLYNEILYNLDCLIWSNVLRTFYDPFIKLVLIQARQWLL